VIIKLARIKDINSRVAIVSGVNNAKVEGNKSNTLRASSSNSVKFLRNKTPDQGDWGIVSGSSTNVEVRGNSLGNFHGILLEPQLYYQDLKVITY
jgi:hypothetical protein